MPAWAQRWMREHDGQTFDIPMLAMFCVAMRRDAWERVGALDERFGIGMFEDDDYSRRVKAAGYRIACARDSFVHHQMGASFGRLRPPEYQALFERNRRLYEEKWGEAWQPHSGPVEAAGATGQ
jgi:GT2 family glycosyltransferase